MSICPRVGGLANYLDQARMTPTYNDWNKRVRKLAAVRSRWSATRPTAGSSRCKDAIKASVHGGMLFEELGFTYLGPIDGHDLKTLRTYLEQVKDDGRPGAARTC